LSRLTKREEKTMRKLPLGLGASTAAALLVWGVMAAAQDAKAPKKGPACNAIKTQATCEGRADCQWIAAVMDETGKQKRKAYCKSKSGPPGKK
jgi:hypothetical protein